jgi:rRNA maturation RNase YbeY
VKFSVYLRNQQRARRVDRKYFCRVIQSLLHDNLHREQYVLAIYLVGTKTITRINETHLRHRGPTDVIAFDYSDSASPALLAGDVFICVDEAIRQARKYKTTWQSELARYAVHGILHLCGFDDQRSGARKKMKHEEDRLMRQLASRFNFHRLEAHISKRARKT